MKIERWDTYEIELHTSNVYSNPFCDVEMTADFVHETTGKKCSVHGFYDGGTAWRVRFMPTELGNWRYNTHSNDRQLDGSAGSLECVIPAKPYLHGPITCRGHHFFHADGTPRFLISTRLSCQFATQQVHRKVIRFLKEHCINRVFFIMGGIAGTLKDLYGQAQDGAIDFDRYVVEKFQAIDAYIDALRQAGILASPYFYYFNDGVLRSMTLEQDRAYIRYGMSRFGAYANLMPVLSNEVEQKYTIRTAGRLDEYDLRSYDWANEAGSTLAELSVFGAPVTVHNPMENYIATNPGFYTLLAGWPFPWAQYMLRQAQVGSLGAASELRDDVPEQNRAVYSERAYARHNQLMIDLRRHGIPVINEEPGYEMGGSNYDSWAVDTMSWNTQTARRMIGTFWTAITAGAYTIWGNPATYELGDPMWGLLDSVVPQRLKFTHDFMTSFPYWEMEPANEAVSANEVEIDGVGYRTNFCLAKPGERYLVFSLLGGRFSLNLKPGGRYWLIHLDPRTGDQTGLGLVDEGDCQVILPAKEQVLLCSLSVKA